MSAPAPGAEGGSSMLAQAPRGRRPAASCCKNGAPAVAPPGPLPSPPSEEENGGPVRGQVQGEEPGWQVRYPRRSTPIPAVLSAGPARASSQQPLRGGRARRRASGP